MLLPFGFLVDGAYLFWDVDCLLGRCIRDVVTPANYAGVQKPPSQHKHVIAFEVQYSPCVTDGSKTLDKEVNTEFITMPRSSSQDQLTLILFVKSGGRSHLRNQLRTWRSDVDSLKWWALLRLRKINSCKLVDLPSQWLVSHTVFFLTLGLMTHRFLR